MIWLGTRSYAIYLIHLPAFKLTHEMTFRYLELSGQAYSPAVVPYVIFIAGLMIALLAELNFRYVEEPLRRIGAARAGAKLSALESPRNTNLYGSYQR
jgi:peptidoglycan/LPS O-acetylase OafA/YrhL